ncbi:MAG: DUF5320 domain-containing protein [Anaerovoracaceae bacterium]
MPRRDGTGPQGVGATGWGFGFCTGKNALGEGTGFRLGAGGGAGYRMGPGRCLGLRQGYGMGFGRSYMTEQSIPDTRKEFLQNQKDLLKNRLKVIEEQLEDL